MCESIDSGNPSTLDDYFVTAAMQRKIGYFTMRAGRNMTVVRHQGALTLINTVRLDDDGLRELDALGKVTNIIRPAGFHGMDDPFYKERYDATLYAGDAYAVDAPYTATFNPAPSPDEIYYTADVVLGNDSTLPIPDARFIEFSSSTPKEGVVLLQREGGIVIPGAWFQNFRMSDPVVNLTAIVMLTLRGFMKPHNIGPGRYRIARPDPHEIQAVLDLKFEHVLPAHGVPVIGRASRLYQPGVSALIKRWELARVAA